MDQSKPQLLLMEEADLEDAIRMEVYGNPENDMQKILLGRDRTPTAIAKLVEQRRKTFRSDAHATFLKVVDPTTQEFMAWAAWHYCPGVSEEEWAKGPEIPEYPLPQFFRPYAESRHETLHGRSYYLLGMLVTAPNYRRRGAASLLLQWGLDRADEAGIEIYLEASVGGKPVYERFGFKTVKVIEFDMAQLGYKGVDTHICMLRPAPGKALLADSSR